VKILQVFADKGAENPALDRHGDVYRISWDITPNEWSKSIQADARNLPLKESAQFELGLFHPPCGGVSPMSDTGDGSRDEWPDLIPPSRDIAKQHCDHYIIENKPRESLDSEVVLDGHMFNLGIEYKRGFETSFPVEQPPKQSKLAETSPFYYSEKPTGWWASVKGSSTEFTKAHLAKNTIPSAYLDYLFRHYYKAIETAELPDYSEYNKEMDTKRAKSDNDSLENYV